MLGQGFAGVPSDAAVTSKQVRSNPRINRETVAALERDNFSADPGAFYHKELTLDLATVSPHVSGPNHVKVMKSVHEMQAKQVKINKAYLVSCVNSRYEDLSQAAEVVRGKKIAPHVKFYIAAAVRHHALLLFPLGCNSHLFFFLFFFFLSLQSSEVQAAAESSGVWGTLLDAGATPLPPGCGPCVGLGTGLLEDGEVGISATNRNFKGRMGSPKAEAYLASPAVVAASAVAGVITAPQTLGAPAKVGGSLKVNTPANSGPQAKVELSPGFPAKMKGRVIGPFLFLFFFFFFSFVLAWGK